MKHYMLFLALALVSFIPGRMAFADHEAPAGSIVRLHRDAHNLEYQVSYSSLRYQVKQAVSRFVSDVSRFYTCIGGRDGVSRDHDLIPGNCYAYLQQSRSSWYPVTRFLYDTYYDYPYVYRAYTIVAQDIKMMP